MSLKLRFSLALTAILISAFCYSQTSSVTVTVDWEDRSHENKVEVYDPANNLLLSICDPIECYLTTGTSLIYTATYDLGCVSNNVGYYVRLFNANNTAWDAASYISVKVAGTEVINNNGSLASTTGFDISFNVAGGDAACAALPDTDGDGVIDHVDLDDDNDGILDVREGLGINSFDCGIPTLDFFGGFYDAAASIGLEGNVGAVYRFPNSSAGLDVLMQVMVLDNTIITNIDDDTTPTPNYLNAILDFTSTGTPGVEFKFTIVDTGTTTPSSSIFRVGGTTWDVDGTSNRQESVIYYNPSAYGVDNPTTLVISDLGGNNIQMSATGILEGPGFSTLPELRSYFQFLGNTFNIRMQNISSSGTGIRNFGMSFTQCDILDYVAPSLTILNGVDTDADGFDDQIDIDADNDGIPDNVETQVTSTYILPSNVFDPINGVDSAYIGGLANVDTDGDGILDYLDADSDNDGTPDIEENGMANVPSGIDADSDGLDNTFETNGILDVTFDVNEDIENPSDLSILPDTDGDLVLGGDLDYRDVIDVYYPSATVDFDGVDDYLSTPTFLDGLQEVTLMAWVKIDPASTATTQKTIVGEDVSCRITLDGGDKPTFHIRGDITPTISITSNAIPKGEWHHIAGTYSGITGEQILYVDGEYINTSPTDFTGSTIDVIGGMSNGNFEVGKFSRLISMAPDQQYFYGSIDEVRVFDKALTADQIQQVVYQEIQNNAGSLRGTIIDKDIVDHTSSSTIPWTKVIAYYPMSDILNTKSFDKSSSARDLTLNNITTLQAQTAPMPYETTSDGDWTTEATWLHGDVWDIEDVPNNKDWSVVEINNNVTTSNSHTQLGMVIQSGKSLSVSGDHEIKNNWYLQLDGTLDLADDSQLVQTNKSDLVTSATGKILRRQEGNSDKYWYNYWSSSVGALNATSLIDNNGTTNNPNNTPYSLKTIKDGAGSTLQFTDAFDEVGKVSREWLYNFQNGVTFWDWNLIDENTAMIPGLGYTQKGTGNAGLEQQYLFEGKPNNGTIILNAVDTGGPGSVEDVSLTTYLVGNPYPSALDARAFITDNAATIGGTILLWEQWAGNTHLLAEYEGGYGYINSMTTSRAYQHPGIPIADPTLPFGIKTPSFYIPVGQGFFVEIENDGPIEFNNGQRIFKQEALNESVFFGVEGATNTENSIQTNRTADNAADGFKLIRLEFATSEGASRHFVLGFNENTTDGFDYGFDGGKISTAPEEDMGSILNGEQYVLQAFAPITPTKEIDLYLKTSGTLNYSIKIDELINIDPSQELFLRDNQENIIWDLRSGAYNFTTTGGVDTDRFDFVFQDQGALSNDEFDNDQVVIFVNNSQDKLFVKGLTEQVTSLTLTNMLGQTIKTYDKPNVTSLENGVYVGDLSSGVYLVNLLDENNLEINKKIILE